MFLASSSYKAKTKIKTKQKNKQNKNSSNRTDGIQKWKWMPYLNFFFLFVLWEIKNWELGKWSQTRMRPSFNTGEGLNNMSLISLAMTYLWVWPVPSADIPLVLWRRNILTLLIALRRPLTSCMIPFYSKLNH